MKILFTGAAHRFAELRKALCQGEDILISHNENAGKVPTESPGDIEEFDWVILDNRENDLDNSDIAGLINSSAPRSGAGAGAVFDDSWASSHHSSPQCGLEWTEKGMLRLRCGFHKIQQELQSGKSQNIANSSRGSVFEYNAPSKKNRF
ncbi:MAG TPA: hypothetical protein ENI65_05350 [Gammaproteobacteria bacterium]|nr:hypothetical protein [Gammaproteobacteria bacterium]